MKKRKLHFCNFLFSAEREGFEPPEPFSSTVFKTAVIDHSTTSPVFQPVQGCFPETDCKGSDFLRTSKFYSMYFEKKSQLFSQPCFRYVKLVTVFRYCAAGYLVTFAAHHGHQLVIRKRVAFILVVDTFLQSLFQFPCGYFLSILVLQSF